MDFPTHGKRHQSVLKLLKVDRRLLTTGVPDKAQIGMKKSLNLLVVMRNQKRISLL